MQILPSGAFISSAVRVIVFASFISFDALASPLELHCHFAKSSLGSHYHYKPLIANCVAISASPLMPPPPLSSPHNILRRSNITVPRLSPPLSSPLFSPKLAVASTPDRTASGLPSIPVCATLCLASSYSDSLPSHRFSVALPPHHCHSSSSTPVTISSSLWSSSVHLEPLFLFVRRCYPVLTFFLSGCCRTTKATAHLNSSPPLPPHCRPCRAATTR